MQPHAGANKQNALKTQQKLFVTVKRLGATPSSLTFSKQATLPDPLLACGSKYRHLHSDVCANEIFLHHLPFLFLLLLSSGAVSGPLHKYPL
jgi:hypothetical protein